MSYDEIKDVIFDHVVLEGTSYDIGRLQGNIIKDNPELSNLYTSLSEYRICSSKNEIEATKKLFEQYCPDINDEIRGFADALSVPVEKVIYYSLSVPKAFNCSHMAVLPSITEDNHIYVGRNYDYNTDNDLRLFTTRVEGKFAHIGFSMHLFGRFDGINEHGLCVTFSAGVPGSNPKEYGFKFWAVIRTILDSFKTVKESVDFINNVPISDNFNLIITDKNGEAALVEVACSKKSIKQVNSNTIERYLCATNHFTLPDMIQHDINRKWHSVARHNIIKERLDMAIPCINKSTIRNILSDTIPEGACCHYYSKGFGTLWSMIFDVTDVNVEICFGSPKENDWIVFGMDDPIGVTKYKAKLPYETADFIIWKKLAPGESIIKS